MRPVVCVKCVLCGSWLPSNKDNLLLNHVKDHHRVSVHLNFLLSACFLDDEGIEQTMTFINKRISSVKDTVEEEEEEEDRKLSDSDPLEMAEMETSSLKAESEAAPTTMEELSDISHNEDLQTESSLEIDQKSWDLPDFTVVNEVSVESSPSSDSSMVRQ